MQGESAAVMSAMAALTDCLSRDEVCLHVPGLSSDQYGATLIVSIAGGFVFFFF